LEELQSPESRAAVSSVPTPPIDVRSTSMAILALLAIIGFLFVARAVFIPITIAVFASYALTPVVDWLREHLHLPKPIGAALTLVVLLAGAGGAVASIQPEALHVLDIVPRATAKFSAAFRPSPLKPAGAVEKMQRAATELQNAADSVAAVSPSAKSAAAAVASKAGPDFNMREYIVMGTASVLAGIGQLVVIVSLTYFLLIAGDSFRRTLVSVSGETMREKKITLQILDEIASQIQRYLLVQVATSALLGFLTWIVFAALHLDNAVFWACVGAVLHLIPYVGPTALVVAVSLVSYVEFDNLQSVVIVIGSTVGIIGLIGLLLVPWLTQRVGRLKAVTVFISLLFWGWLWGVWGLLLGVPIVMAINAICERVVNLQPIAAFLGYGAAEPGPSVALVEEPKVALAD
jgi:predicted PurR-regulated permease PerM